MIVSFYDHEFTPLLNNANLTVDNKTYKLIKRPVELNELTCKCEAFNEDIQPTFLVISDERKRYVYGCLAGVPILNEQNQTEIIGTDLKTMLSSDIILGTTIYAFSYVYKVISYIFTEWATQLGYKFGIKYASGSYSQITSTGIMDCDLIFKNHDVQNISVSENYTPTYPIDSYNAYDELKSILRYYNLYIDTKLDVVNKKVQFIIGKTLTNPLIDDDADAVNIKLWEYGIKNYGKVTCDINESQGYVLITENKDPDASHTEPYTVSNFYPSTYQGVATKRWILLKNGNITSDTSLREIYPIKRKIVLSSENMIDANTQALELLLDAKFNESIELLATDIKPRFETRFEVYTQKGEAKYKDLPCGELQYDASGLVKFKIGYRYTGVDFI